VDYRAQPFEDVVAKVDVVLDTIGGDTQARSLQVLKTGGRLVSIVQTPDAEKLGAVGARGGFVMVQPNSEQLKVIGDLIDKNQVRVVIDSVFGLSQVRDAHTRSETGRAKGKIVLEVIPEPTGSAQ
jgi:NADPH:quinone reductase-like Zn-dependent oxidoreductase